jgi:hypothetical protein
MRPGGFLYQLSIEDAAMILSLTVFVERRYLLAGLGLTAHRFTFVRHAVPEGSRSFLVHLPGLIDNNPIYFLGTLVRDPTLGHIVQNAPDFSLIWRPVSPPAGAD